MSTNIKSKYRYSIAYPDKEEINYVEQSFYKEEIVELIQKFDWDKELKKEIEFYSPRIDIYNIEDRRRIIFSGIGINKLQEFQVMFIEPKIDYTKKVFDDNNYKNTNSYTKSLSLGKGDETLGYFFKKDYSQIIQLLNHDSISISNRDKSTVKSKNNSNTEDHESINIYLKLFLAFCAPLLTLITFLVSIKLYELEEEAGYGTITTFLAAILFLVATYKIWSQLLNKNRNT